MAAAERVVPIRAARSATPGSPRLQMTWLPAGSRVRVTPSATIRASHKMGAPAWSAARPASTTSGEQRMSTGRSVMPQAWIIRTARVSADAGMSVRSASARMRAKDRR